MQNIGSILLEPYWYESYVTHPAVIQVMIINLYIAKVLFLILFVNLQW